MKVLGNPITNGQIKIQLRLASGRYTFEVVSMEGQVLTTTSMVADENVTTKSMSLAEVSKGVYTLRVRSAKNNYSERILIP
jgi:hypothetical protein